MTPTSQWYAVRTATRREHDAVTALTEAGFVCYFPADTHERKLNGVKTPVMRPRYPGYGFVQCQAEETPAVRDVRFIHEVLRWVGDDGLPRPLAVPPKLIAEIFAAQWAGRFDRRTAEYIPARGDWVRLKTGKWAAMGYLYEIISISSDKRRALLNYAGWKVEEDMAHLAAA